MRSAHEFYEFLRYGFSRPSHRWLTFVCNSALRDSVANTDSIAVLNDAVSVQQSIQSNCEIFGPVSLESICSSKITGYAQQFVGLQKRSPLHLNLVDLHSADTSPLSASLS